MCKITPYPLENFTLDWNFLHNQRLRWLWQIAGMGLPGLDSWSPLTLTWYWVPSGSPGSQKGPILAQMWNVPNFHGPIFVGYFLCLKYSLVGCPEHHNGKPCSSSTVAAHMEPSSLRTCIAGVLPRSASSHFVKCHFYLINRDCFYVGLKRPFQTINFHLL